MILLLKHISPAKVGHTIQFEFPRPCVGKREEGKHLQVSPESLSPAIATNLLAPSSSGLDTLVLVFAIVSHSVSVNKGSKCQQHKLSAQITALNIFKILEFLTMSSISGLAQCMDQILPFFSFLILF